MGWQSLRDVRENCPGRGAERYGSGLRGRRGSTKSAHLRALVAFDSLRAGPACRARRALQQGGFRQVHSPDVQAVQESGKKSAGGPAILTVASANLVEAGHHPTVLRSASPGQAGLRLHPGQKPLLADFRQFVDSIQEQGSVFRHGASPPHSGKIRVDRDLPAIHGQKAAGTRGPVLKNEPCHPGASAGFTSEEQHWHGPVPGAFKPRHEFVQPPRNRLPREFRTQPSG